MPGPARLAGLWPATGNLSPGAVADLVIWNTDLHRLPPDDLAAAHPTTTILAGEVVYRERSEASSVGESSRLERVPTSGGA